MTAATHPVAPAANGVPLDTQKVARKSSKPIINWLQRKLGGTHRRNAPPSSGRPQPQRKQSSRTPDRARSLPRTSTNTGRDDPNCSETTDPGTSLRRSTISSRKDSSLGEADEDASMRPIPPTSPSSPAPSRSSSSFVSDPNTFKSAAAASTRPTTLLSIDMGANGMAHIAQAPSTPNSVYNYGPNPSPSLARFGSPGLSGATRTSGSISSLNPNATFSSLPSNAALNGRTNVQAPLHTNHHPRYNPRPGSPPNENASMITLASSAYAMGPGQRFDGWPGDSQSQLMADNASHTVMDDLLPEEPNLDASVRALRPRSSRHASWDSEVSKWSAGSPGVQERSVRTAPSLRLKTAEKEEGEDDEDSKTQENAVAEAS